MARSWKKAGVYPRSRKMSWQTPTGLPCAPQDRAGKGWTRKAFCSWTNDSSYAQYSHVRVRGDAGWTEADMGIPVCAGQQNGRGHWCSAELHAPRTLATDPTRAGGVKSTRRRNSTSRQRTTKSRQRSAAAKWPLPRQKSCTFHSAGIPSSRIGDSPVKSER